MKRIRCPPRDYSSSFEALCYLHIHRETFNRVRATRGGQSGDDWADFWCLNRNKNQLGRYSDTLHEHLICLLLKLSVDAPTWKDANHTLELWNCSFWNISGGRQCSGTVAPSTHYNALFQVRHQRLHSVGPWVLRLDFGLQLQQLHLPCPCAIPCTNSGGTHGTTHAHVAFFLQWVLTTHHPLQSVKCRVRGPVLTRHQWHLRMLFTRTALAVTMAFENCGKESHQQPLVEGQRTANFNLSTKFWSHEQFHLYSIFEPSILLH
jgi:hypothetical protein